MNTDSSNWREQMAALIGRASVSEDPINDKSPGRRYLYLDHGELLAVPP